MHLYASQRSIPTCLVLVLSLLVSGCATSQYGEQITTVNYYPQCYAPINDLRVADKSYNKTIVAGAGIGVLAGALVGLMATGKAEGALAGAAVGGVAGAGVGYAKAKQDRIADDNQRMASYLHDIDGDISGLDRAMAAARVARNCYDKEFQSAIALYKAGKMPRQELDRRYVEINNGITESANILGSLISAAGERETEYQQALTEEANKANRPVPEVKTVAQAAPPDPKTTAKTATKAPAKPQKAAARTPRPSKDDTSIEAVAQNTQRLSETRQAAADEQAAMLRMNEEMKGTLATVTS